MARVKFTDPDEFMEEIKKEKSIIKLVRLTNLLTPLTGVPNIRALSVVATAQVEPNILRMEKYCGLIWGLGEQDQKHWDEAKAIQDKIEKACQELKIEVRAGIIEE